MEANIRRSRRQINRRCDNDLWIGIFSTFAGFIANFFLAPRKKKEVIAKPSDPKFKLAEMRKMLEEQEKTTADLKLRLEEMEEIL